MERNAPGPEGRRLDVDEPNLLPDRFDRGRDCPRNVAHRPIARDRDLHGLRPLGHVAARRGVEVGDLHRGDGEPARGTRDQHVVVAARPLEAPAAHLDPVARLRREGLELHREGDLGGRQRAEVAGAPEVQREGHRLVRPHLGAIHRSGDVQGAHMSGERVRAAVGGGGNDLDGDRSRGHRDGLSPAEQAAPSEDVSERIQGALVPHPHLRLDAQRVEGPGAGAGGEERHAPDGRREVLRAVPNHALNLRLLRLPEHLRPEAGRLGQRGDAVAVHVDPREDPVLDGHGFVLVGAVLRHRGLHEEVLRRNPPGRIGHAARARRRGRRIRDRQRDRLRPQRLARHRHRHRPDLEGPLRQRLVPILVGDRDGRAPARHLERARRPRTEEVREVGDVGEGGLVVHLLRPRHLDVEHELAADPDLRGAQEGTHPDLLRPRDTGRRGEGEQRPDQRAGPPNGLVHSPYRPSLPAGTTVTVKGWARAVPYDSDSASK